MEKQKNTRRPKKSASEYLDAFKRIKMEIDLNPKVKTSKITREFGISHFSVAKLKQLGIINESEHGLFWIGIEPTSQMVNSVKSLFNVPSIKKLTKTIKGTSEPKNHAPQAKIEFKEQESILTIEEWNKRLSSQIAEITEMAIQEQIQIDSSSIPELSEIFIPEATLTKAIERRTAKERQKRTMKSKEKIFELKIFGLKLFTIKY